MTRTPSKQRRAHITSRARWAVSEIGAIAGRGYAARREFQYLRYLLERAYRLKVPGLPPRDEILERLATLEPTCTARWEQVKAERQRRRKRRRRVRRKGANMSQELREHARRLGSADQAAQAAAVEGVRQELRADSELAKRKLAEIEKEGPAILREVEEIEADLALAGKRRPDISRWTMEIRRVFLGGSGHPHDLLPARSVPEQLREGLKAYDGLRYEHIADGNARRAFLTNVRSLLRSWDGALSFARQQLGAMRTYVKEWHEADPGPPTSAAAVGIIREERPAGIQTETEFEMGGRIFGRRPGA